MPLMDENARRAIEEVTKSVNGFEAIVQSFSSGFQVLKLSFVPPDDSPVDEICYVELLQSMGIRWDCECWVVKNLQLETVNKGRYRLFQGSEFSVVFGDANVEWR